MMSISMEENIKWFQTEFDGSADFTVRRFRVTGTGAAMLTLEGMVSKDLLALGVLAPMMDAVILEQDAVSKFNYIRDNALATVDQKEVDTYEQAMMFLMNGFAVFMLDGCLRMIVFGVQGFPTRGVSEPQNEVMQSGSREGFVENFKANMTMLRRRMRTPKLKFETMSVGKLSKTNLCLCYVRGTVSEELLNSVRQRIKQENFDTVLGAGYIAPGLMRGHGFLFSGVGRSERPDTVCGKLNEGRIAVIVDGSPSVLIVPHLFVENFQSMDDYINRPFYATFTRWLKYLSFLLAVFLPGYYVSAVTFHPELLPEALFTKIAFAESTTPFPVMLEAVVIHFLYELMREAGLRVPRTLSQAVSIVGALVIGDTAVSSGLVGAPTLLVIAIAATATYLTPSLYETTSVLRLAFILIGAFTGIWGLALGFFVLLLNICGETVYRIPFGSPVSPFRFSAMRDVLIRAGWGTLSKHTAKVQNMPGSNLNDLNDLNHRNGGGE